MDPHEYMAHEMNRACHAVSAGWIMSGYLSILDKGKYEVVVAATGGTKPTEICVYATLKSNKFSSTIPCSHTLVTSGTYTKWIDGIREETKIHCPTESWLKKAVTEVIAWVDGRNEEC